MWCNESLQPVTMNHVFLLFSNVPIQDGATDEDYFEFTCPKEDGQFDDPYQCDKYYECNGGRVTEKLCPDGLVFDPTSKLANKCDQPYNVDCKDRTELRESRIVQYSFVPLTDRMNITEKAKPIGVCPRQNGFFPHPDNTICNVFYNCVNGREIEMNCVAGLHFSLKTGTCVWPDMANREDCGSNANSMCKQYSS